MKTSIDLHFDYSFERDGHPKKAAAVRARVRGLRVRRDERRVAAESVIAQAASCRSRPDRSGRAGSSASRASRGEEAPNDAHDQLSEDCLDQEEHVLVLELPLGHAGGARCAAAGGARGGAGGGARDGDGGGARDGADGDAGRGDAGRVGDDGGVLGLLRFADAARALEARPSSAC